VAVDLHHHARHQAQVRLSGELLKPDYTHDFTAKTQRGQRKYFSAAKHAKMRKI
jgi:hypothetical protein